MDLGPFLDPDFLFFTNQKQPSSLSGKSVGPFADIMNGGYG